LNDILVQEGYKTTIAQTGKEAIKVSKKGSFNVAIIDIKLPDIKGTNLLNILKKLNPNLIGIIITGYPSLENAVQSLNSGADGYIVKPFKPLRLLEQIKEQLERRQKANWENILSKTGLSVNEAKVYLSLATEGCSEARKLSMSSGVPRTKTYAALKKLAQRELVHEVPGGTQRFSIATPSSAFSNFVQGWKKELSEQAKNLIEFENAIKTIESIQKEKQTAKHSTMQKEDVWSIEQAEEIALLTSEILSNAKVSVCLVTTEIGLVFFHKNYGKILDDLAEKGVTIQIKVPIESSNKSFVHELKYVYKVENMQVTVPIFLLIVDKNNLLLASLRKDDHKTFWDKELMLFSQGGTLSSFVASLMGFDKTAE
jgi:sugar-specific transcriptional regulator TrmB/CheY-like chemotaxis protein